MLFCIGSDAEADLSYAISVPMGLGIIANQLDHGSNTLDEVFAGVPDGCVIYKRNNASGTWAVSAYSAATGSWADGGAIALNPGDGAFLRSPVSFELMITGAAHSNSVPVSLAAGACYLLSRQTNDIGDYASIVGSAPSNGAAIYQWNGSNYTTYSFSGGVWSPTNPSVAVGEAVWVASSNGSPAALPQINIPTNKVVECGSAWGFDAPSLPNPCGGTAVISVLDTVTSGICPQVITRTWLGSDACGDTFACSQTVTVVDQTPPLLTCAGDKSVPCGSAWSFDPPAAVDGCSGTNVALFVLDTVTNGNGCSQSYTRTWMAIDACGNSNSCSQTVTLTNYSPLVLTCATNRTVPCGPGCVGLEPPVETVLKNIGDQLLGGISPNGGLVEGANAAIYGTTYEGGANGYGAVFRLNEDGSGYRILYSFGANAGDGRYPYGTLALGGDGALYGTTYEGGTNGAGTIFKLNQDGSGYQELYSFGANANDGQNPFASLLDVSSNVLYGTTYGGGTNGFGTIFSINEDGSGYRELHSFGDSPADGQYPYAGLAPGGDGALYGTALYGGANDVGIVFRIETDGTAYNILHTFGSTQYDGELPEGGVTEGLDGNLYGTTYYGGAYSAGTVYKISKDGSLFFVLHNFNSFDGDGWNPGAGLVKGCGGAFYSTTEAGGSNSLGTVYELSEDGSEYRILHSFSTAAGDGQVPEAALLPGSDGALYGTTLVGGSTAGGVMFGGYGTVYRLAAPSGWTFDAPAVSGGCGNPSVVILDTVTNTGSITRTWMVTDGCGNSNACSQTLYVTCGSVSVAEPVGSSSVSTPFELGGNTLNEVLTHVPDGTVFQKYNNGAGTWTTSTYSAAAGSWDNGDSITLSPGEGAFLQSPLPFELTLYGTPHVPTPVSIPNGQAYLLGNQTNNVGTYDSIAGSAPTNGAQLFAWDNASSSYTVYTYSNSWSPSAPSVPVGRAVWIAPAGGTPAPMPQSYAIAIDPGLNIIANQLDHGSNTLDEVVAHVPDGTKFYKRDNGSGSWITSIYSAATGSWSDGDTITLNPGEGAFLQSPARFTLPFTGTPHATTTPVVIPSGEAYLLSRQTNGVGTYDNIVGSAPTNGAQLFAWDNSSQAYTVYSYSNSWSPSAPSVPVGRAVWIAPGGGGAPPSSPQSYTVVVEPGLNVIANQLDHGSNTLDEVMAQVPDGTKFYKRDNGSGSWITSIYSSATASWVNGDTITLNPGEGAFLQSPTNFTLLFSGSPHASVEPVTIPPGAAYLLSRQTNDVGTYDNIVGSAPTNGAQVFAWDSSNQTYTVYSYSGVWSPSAPSVPVGEAVWIAPGGGTPSPPPQSYSISVSSGLSLIANQLDHGSNTLDEVMAGVPGGAVLYKYNNASGTWTISGYSAATAAWADGAAITLNPGEGAFLQSPSNFTLLFAGTPHVPVLPISIPSGTAYLLSAQTNAPGYYTNIVGTAPPSGATVYRFEGGSYLVSTFIFGQWNSEPVTAIGESEWIAPSGGSPAPPPGVTFGADKTVQCGDVWTFDPPALTGACGSNETVTVLNTVTNGGPCPAVITRTWRVTDPCGDSAAFSQTVTVTQSLLSTVIAAPVLTANLSGGTNTALTFPTRVGATYVVEYKDNLGQPDWTTLKTVTGDGSIMTVMDPGPMPAKRFYRLCEVVP